eukprot:scaffold451_cov341-Pavlova_lutheri.AAC.1
MGLSGQFIDPLCAPYEVACGKRNLRFFLVRMTGGEVSDRLKPIPQGMAVEFRTVKGRRQGECGARDPYGIKGGRRKGAHLVRLLHHSSTNQGTFNELVAWSLALLMERIYQKIEPAESRTLSVATLVGSRTSPSHC